MFAILTCHSINLLGYCLQPAEDAKQIDDDIKARMKAIFCDELLRRYAITSTLEMAQGTVVPLVKYPADDIVVDFYKKERDTELAGEDWDAEADCEYLRVAMKGAGKGSYHVMCS